MMQLALAPDDVFENIPFFRRQIIPLVIHMRDPFYLFDRFPCTGAFAVLRFQWHMLFRVIGIPVNVSRAAPHVLKRKNRMTLRQIIKSNKKQAVRIFLSRLPSFCLCILYHTEIPECIQDGIPLHDRAVRLLSVFALSQIVVLPLQYSALFLNLSYV